MKVLLLTILLAGCSSGYEVERRNIPANELGLGNYKYEYICSHVKGWSSIILRICQEPNECNEYCDKMRGEAARRLNEQT